MTKPGTDTSSGLARVTLGCLLLSLVVHGGGLVWFESAQAGDAARGEFSKSDDQPTQPNQPEQSRLGIQSAERATINWLGFAEPTQHRAAESDTDQAALSLSPPGAPAPPSSPRPQTPTARPAEASPPQVETVRKESVREKSVPIAVAEPVESPVTPSPANAGSEDEQAPMISDTGTVAIESDKSDETKKEEIGPVDAEAQPPEEPAKEAQQEADVVPEPPSKQEQKSVQLDSDSEGEPSDEASQPSPQAEVSGADSIPGIIADRESTPTSKVVDLAVKDWGKPAAGKGIRVKPVRPRFPDTLAAFGRVLDATVLIDFGADGFVRDVRFESVLVKGRRVSRNTGSPEADRVLLNSVYNWSASGQEIDDLASQGAKGRITIRMQMRIRP